MTAKEIAEHIVLSGCHLPANEVERMILRHMEDRLKDADLRFSELMSLLKKCEWADSCGSEPVKICPVCGQDEGYGHNDDCELAKAVDSTNFNPTRHKTNEKHRDVCSKCGWDATAEEEDGYPTWSRSMHPDKNGELTICSHCT